MSPWSGANIHPSIGRARERPLQRGAERHLCGGNSRSGEKPEPTVQSG